MKTAIVFCLVLACTAMPQESRVPEAIQRLRAPLTSISLKDIFKNMQNLNTVTFYTKCVTGDGTCDRVGAALRHLLVDHIPGQDLCNRCSACEKERVQYVLDTMLEKYPKHACHVQQKLSNVPIFAKNPCAA